MNILINYKRLKISHLKTALKNIRVS